jgi:hypothetical protein
MMVGLALFLVSAATAQGQPKPPGAEFPAIADVIAAHRAVRSWVSAFEIPSPDDAASHVRIDGAEGVCVILRSEGRVMGLGTAMMGGELDVRRASARAMGDVLSDAAVVGLPEGLRGMMGPQLCVEVEAAGVMIPTAAGSFAEFTAQIEPGLDGLAVRRGEQWAARFPAQLRATNSAGRIDSIMPGLARELGLTAAGFRQLLEDDEISLYRFRTIHLAQTSPGAAPFATERGDVIVEEQQVTKPSIRRFADRLAAHIIRCQHGGETGARDQPLSLETPRGLAGAYRPVSDDYDPLIAPPAEQALGALALARYAAAPGVGAGLSVAAIETAASLLRQLEAPASASPGGDEVASQDELVTSALLVLAAEALPPQRVDEAIASRIAKSRAALAAHLEAADDQAKLTAPARAVIAAALARLHRGAPGSLEAALVRAAIDAAWDAAPEPERVALLPWIGWAEIDWADAAGGPVVRAAELESLRGLLWASQIRAGEDDQPRDLGGGFALRSEGITSASAASTKPCAWLGAAMRDPRLTSPDQTMLEAARCLRAMRFLMQLSVREEAMWSHRRPERALGGIRNAPWDSEQALAPQAMGLIAAAELLASLETLESRGKR